MAIKVKNINQESRYKQTEVGLIPEDWKVDNLKQFWAVIDCKHLTAKFVENGIPLASIREVQSRFVELENAKQTTQIYYLALIEGGRKPQPGDLIFSRNATVGEVAQVAEWHPLFAMGQDVCLFRKRHSSFSSDYLQAVVQSHIVLKQFANSMVGSTFKRVNVEQIQNLIVPMPLPKEQQAIATALSDVDALITSLDKLIVKKRDIKQATMQQLLTGKTRLPGFSSNGTAKLGEFFELNPSKIHLNDKDLVTFIGMEDISENGHIINQNIMPFSGIKKGLTFFEQNDVLVAKITPCFENGKGACLDIIETKLGFGSTEFHVLRAKKNAIPRYIFYQTQTVEFRQCLEAEMTGTAGQKRVPSQAIINYPLPTLHSKDEQQAIATILTDMDAEIVVLEQRRDKTRALKQGMMQELLTGKTRLL